MKSSGQRRRTFKGGDGIRPPVPASELLENLRRNVVVTNITVKIAHIQRNI